MKSKLIIALSLLSSVAFADSMSLQFRFNVNSAASDFYPCNAGLNTTGNADLGSTYNGVTLAPIADCSVNPDNCVTINKKDQYKKNTVTASYVPWATRSAAASNVTVTSASDSAVGTAGVLFNVGAQASWENVLKSLSFDLSSPGNDAEFFVDFCYRGPQKEFFEKNNYPFKWYISASYTTANLATSTTSYSTAAGVQSYTVLACDIQGLGTYQYGTNAAAGAGSAAGLYNTLSTDAVSTNIQDGLNGDAISGATTQIKTALTAAPGVGTLNPMVAQVLEDAGAAALAPRFCKIRMYFKENNTLRSWNQAGSLFTINAKVDTY